MYQNYNIKKFSFFSFFISINSKKNKKYIRSKEIQSKDKFSSKKKTHINFLLKEIQYKNKNKNRRIPFKRKYSKESKTNSTRNLF